MTPSPDRSLRIDSTEVVWREVGAELVVLHMSTATYLTVNGSGRALWDLLVDGATREQLVAELVGRYAIDAPRARHDVEAFIGSLVACSLLDASP